MTTKARCTAISDYTDAEGDTILIQCEKEAEHGGWHMGHINRNDTHEWKTFK